MRKSIAAPLCLALLSLAASTPLALAQQKNSGELPVYSSIREIMDSIVDPSADVIWGAVGTIVDKDQGIRDLLPRTPQDWLNVRRAAVRIVEGGNLLMMPGREAAPRGSKSETPGVELEPVQITALINRNRRNFDAFARQLRLAGAQALLATDARNGDRLMDAGASMENACEGCHQAFWYPSVSTPQSAGR
jgi:hypothetical protein